MAGNAMGRNGKALYLIIGGLILLLVALGPLVACHQQQ